MANSTQVVTKTTSKRPAQKKLNALSTCPTGGIGWCVYPFSLGQLEKKLKQNTLKDKKTSRSHNHN